METPRKLWLTGAIACLFSLLVGCSGGDEDEEEEEEPPSAAGVWQGTFQLRGYPFRGFNLLVTPDGQFAGLVNASSATSADSRIMVGTGETLSTGTIVVNGSYHPLQGQTLPGGSGASAITAFSGHVVEGQTITGSMSAAGETADFELSFHSSTTRSASLAKVQGVYSTPSSSATMAINATGQVVFNSVTGCIGNGTIAFVQSTLNVYTWSLNVSNCESAGNIQGLATLADFNGIQENRIVMVGARSGGGFYFTGVK